jgi:hypothetical protein
MPAVGTLWLKTELRNEIRRVLDKSKRWRDRAKEFPDVKSSFIGPADRMLKDATEAYDIMQRLGDEYSMSVALDNLRAYHDDD